MRGSIKCTCMRFHSLWNGEFAKSTFGGCLAMSCKFYFLVRATYRIQGPNAIG